MKYKTKTYIIGLLSGVLLALSFPPFPFFYLAYFGFVPLLFALEERNGQKSFWLIYLTFFLYHTITNWWIGSYQPHADPFLMASGIILSFYHPLFFLVPVYAYLFIRRKFGLKAALWLFPVIWVSFEWLHSLGEMSYPWLTIGYTQAYNELWIQSADIFGIWGVSFLIAMINSLIAGMLFAVESCELGVVSCFKLGKSRNLLLIILLLIILPYIYGLFRINEFQHKEMTKDKKTLNIGIIQPNINPWLKWEKNVLEQIGDHIRIQDSLLRKKPDIDLFLLPETAIPFYDFNLNSSHNFGALKYWIDKNKVSVLTGFADIKLYLSKEAPGTAKKLKGAETLYYESYNAAVILNPGYKDTSELKIYHKMRLTPFSERFPYGRYLKFATEWFKWGVGISSWNTGEKQFPLIYNNSKKNAKIGAVICIESVYPDFTRNYITQGVELLVVITNDAWFDHTFGPEQHFVISQVRAIETRRYIVRCANSGLSGFISPTGERIKLLPQYEVAAKSENIPLLSYKSIYTLVGDIFVYFSTFISVTFIIFGLFIKKPKHKDLIQ